VSARIAWIHVAPIKALAIQELEQVEIGRLGVEGDRRFCVIDPDGKMLNAKRVQKLVTIRPHFDEAMRQLELAMPDGSTVQGAVDLGEPIVVSIYRRKTPARIVKGPWSEALSVLAERPVHLARFDEPGEGVDRTGEDAGVTLLSEASLSAIARAAGVASAVDPRRFRMLFGIAGVEAHAEDGWIGSRVHVGPAIVVPRGNVGRCAVTTLDPVTGASDLDTLGALAAYRGTGATTEPLAFGVWGHVAQAGTVKVGDPVHVA
jgi:uncharacterized protein YcbX